MDYILMKRVGEVEEEHSFTDLTIDEWLVIWGALSNDAKEDKRATNPNKGFDIDAALRVSSKTTAPVWGGLKE